MAHLSGLDCYILLISNSYNIAPQVVSQLMCHHLHQTHDFEFQQGVHTMIRNILGIIASLKCCFFQANGVTLGNVVKSGFAW
jgi:hypothetical protein